MTEQQSVSYNAYCLKREQLLGKMNEEGGGGLPSHFELVVVGTGLEESIVAAAAARNGHTVLHIDFDDYYGGDWAAFNFEGIQNWVKKNSAEAKDESDKKDLSALAEKYAKEGESVIALNSDKVVRNVVEQWYVPEKQEEVIVTEEKEEDDGGGENDVAVQAPPHPKALAWTQQTVSECSRRFNLDLVPKLLFSRGAMVELLISSNISRYTEFKSVSRVLTLVDGNLEHVPSSRADVFATKRVSVVEKRILMKFLTFCVTYEEHADKYEAFKEATFKEFLKHEKLTANLIHFVLHSIAMVPEDADCLVGLAATAKFLRSLGRFGNTPFLWSMYGAGEMPQAFCRLCAVFGGTYFLGRALDGILVEGDKVKAIISNGQRIDCDQIVLPANLCPEQMRGSRETSFLRREMALVTDSMMPNEKEQLTFLSIPPKTAADPYSFVQEVGFGAAACPKGMYCLQGTTAAAKEEDCETQSKILQQVVSDRSKLVWSLNFDMKVEKVLPSEKEESNVFECNGPPFELDYDESIAHAKEIYSRMFAGEEFLPRAPEPEEIILGEGDGDKEGQEEEIENNDKNVGSEQEKSEDGVEQSEEKKEESKEQKEESTS